MNIFKVFTRYFVGVILIIYGIVKFFKLQKFSIQPTGSIHDIKPDELFWYFFGYSQLYLNVIGFIEVLGGILFLVPKTQRVGALITFSLVANITLMDFIYNIGPVKYWAFFLTVLSSIYIFLESEKYLEALKKL